MDYSLTSRPGRGLNLPNTGGGTVGAADEEKGDQLIKSTFALLERGEEEIKFDDNHKDVVLILGNTGSGKSTFTQWVAGDNSKLVSKETKEGTGDYIIEDHNRIGDTTLKSKTIFPELVIDATTDAAFYDCPGFSDTQGTSHDIATTYFIKRVVDYSERVKMVFTISHPSVRKGVDRHDFLKLLRHVTDLVKDVEKFKNSIAIVATKVDNQYIKKGRDFVLVEDDKVIAAVADFLQEAKQYLEDESKRANLFAKEIRFYDNAIKFVEVLLEKVGENYPRIGIFRRPDEAGIVSDIPLLQKGKKSIERIVYERLNFTVKNHEDFGYTVSEKTKNDITDLVTEINKNLWSSLSDIARNIQEYYRNLVKQVRDKIHSFVSDASGVDVNFSEAEDVKFKLSRGYIIISDVVNKTKNLTDPEKLAGIANNTILNLNIDQHKYDIVYIENQGKYFTFLQTVSDKTLDSMPWYQLFKDVETFLADSKTVILNDLNSVAETINNRLQINLNDAVRAMQEEYTEKFKTFEMQKLREKLNQESHFICDVIKEMKNGTTTEELANAISYVANNLEVSSPKESILNIENHGKYLRFMELLCDKTLVENKMAWLYPFQNLSKYFKEFEKWYSFLEDLQRKFSEYDIQKDRQRYNVADLEDWGQPDKPQGISVTSNTFGKFLDKIGNYNVTECEIIKNMTTTSLQIEELNQVLSLTLKHRATIRCSEPFVVVKGNFISLNEAMQNIMGNSDTNNSCINFKALQISRKYKLFKFLALNRLFIDTDLSFSGKGISVVAIAPRWEVIGSRSIDLGGTNGTQHSERKAQNGFLPGNSGADGAPGNPGASGESFFGIGATYIGGSNLKISSNGGMGGPGQDGGDGGTGVSGRDAITPAESDPPCENGHFREFSCEKLKENLDQFNTGDYTRRTDFRIFGLPGRRGGNGGDGGKGGKGGEPGNIAILELDKPSGITQFSAKGKEGGNGKGGTSQGGKYGDDTLAEWREDKMMGVVCMFMKCYTTTWVWKETLKNNARGPSGKSGLDGGNAAGLKNPVTANGIRMLPNILNEYKTFLRENINNRLTKWSLKEFLSQISSKDDVNKLYNTLGLIDEFHGLEGQFHRLSKQMDFNPFYSSLLERIKDFSKTLKDSPNSSENRKALNYLYTAILGKVYNLRENSEQNLIIDIQRFLSLITENIRALRDLETTNNKVNVIKKYKEDYKKSIDKKIEEAKSFIEKQISPEIKNINSDIDNRVSSIIEEIIAMQKQAEKERKNLVEKKKELEDALAKKGLFSFLQIVGGIVRMLGPIGEIAGTMIETTSTVGESLILNNHKKTLNLPLDVVSTIETIGDQIKAMRNKKVVYLEKLLEDITKEIKKTPEKLSDMTGKIDEIKDKLKRASEKKMDFRLVKELERELKQELKRKGNDLKCHGGDRKSIDALMIIEKVTQIAQFGSLLLNVYDKMKEDKDKMDAVTDAMGKIENKIEKLKEYEENIYEIILPMLQEMENHMQDVREKLGSKSQVALDVTRWQVQSTLKDVKLEMQRLTEGFEVKDDISRSIEKLDEVMSTLINVYDRIQSYQDQENLANYIADISSVSSSNIIIQDEQLLNALNHLESAIRANIVIKQYKSAMNAFKQWVFPFADHYIEKPMLPSQLVLDTNIENLVQNATKEIEAIKQKLDLYDTSVKNGDQYLQCEEFSSQYVSSKPFFVWTKEEYGSLISDLLSGKEVVLKADIRTSARHKDAIKFSEIDFDFKIANQTAQFLLSEILKGFDIRATHLGNSYYRYANETFLITSDSVTIAFSKERNDIGMPIRSNNVYNKLKSGDLLLSPYTLWEVRMVNQTNQYSFEDLESYKNKIDVELSGFGSYVDTNVIRIADVVNNGAKLDSVRLKAAGLNQCRRPKYRLVRSPREIQFDDHVTNGGAASVPSPINFFFNFLKTNIVSNAIISFNRIFSGKQISLRNCSELPYGCTEMRKIGPNSVTKIKIRDTDVESRYTSEGGYKKEVIPKLDSIVIAHFEDTCSKYFLSCDPKDGSSFNLISVVDLDCSLLLADMVSRTLTGNRYKSPVHECFINPGAKVIFRKICDGAVRNESDVEEMLQRHLSEKEYKEPRSWICKLNDYAKMMFQFLGIVGTEDTEECVKDIRHLFT